MAVIKQDSWRYILTHVLGEPELAVMDVMNIMDVFDKEISIQTDLWGVIFTNKGFLWLLGPSHDSR